MYVLSDSVGIASGFIALRTIGGFLPTAWPNGIDVAEDRKKPGGRKATVIDVPFSAETAVGGAEAIAAFRAAVTWLPAFARAIRRVEIVDDATVTVDCALSEPFGGRAICIVSVSCAHRERALRLDLFAGYSLLLRIDAGGRAHSPRI